MLFVLLMSLALHRPAFESLLFAVSLAVGLTPEFLPMITSVTLSRGALAMARKQVIVKRLPAIQNLGSIDILCSDKTGTITSGALELHASLGPDAQPSTRALAAARINSQQQTGIHSPLDTAILATPMHSLSMPRKLDEIPFDFERRRLSVIVERDGKNILICKGSPEGILPLVTAMERDGRDVPVTTEDKTILQQLYERESANGFRVLAVAERELGPKANYTVADENDFTFLGYLSFADPILPEAADTIQRLKMDGIDIKILSGDSDLVTKHICRDAGMSVTDVVLGDDLEHISEPALLHLVQKVNVFARLSPAQKVRVLSALRRSGHVVGFIGDGINDDSSHACGRYRNRCP